MKLKKLILEGRLENIVKQQIGNIKYMSVSMLPGLIASCTHYKDITLSDDLIDAIKSVISDYFWDDVEPEWASEEAYIWWEKMDASYFELDGTFKPGKKFNGPLVDN